MKVALPIEDVQPTGLIYLTFFIPPFPYKCVHKIEEEMLFFFFFFSNLAIHLIYGKVCALFCVFARLEPFYSL